MSVDDCPEAGLGHHCSTKHVLVLGRFGSSPDQVRAGSRVATLRFGHPFAAVAAVSDHGPVGAVSRWHGMPVFSARVTEPSDAA